MQKQLYSDGTEVVIIQTIGLPVKNKELEILSLQTFLKINSYDFTDFILYIPKDVQNGKYCTVEDHSKPMLRNVLKWQAIACTC